MAKRGIEGPEGIKKVLRDLGLSVVRYEGRCTLISITL